MVRVVTMNQRVVQTMKLALVDAAVDEALVSVALSKLY